MPPTVPWNWSTASCPWPARGTGNKVSLKSTKVIRQALKLFRIFLPEAITIEQELSYDDFRIMADPSQIHQAITNLLKNAQEAIGDGPGKVRVSSTVGALRNRDVETAGLEPGKYVRLVVNDNGPGMDEETLSQIFDPYFSTKKKGSGAGMGLTIAQAIAKSHNGAILAQSTLGKGTTMILLLPILEMETKVKPVIPSKLPTGDERILVVDDEELLASTLARMLTTLGYHVTKVDNSKDALSFFRDYHDGLELVISDWAMPEIRGDRLAELMLEIDPNAKVILYSAFESEITRQQLALPGIQAVLQKPIALSELAHTVRKILDAE
jgi:CheY-like chemotaxis protein